MNKQIKKVAILGAGNLGKSIANGIVNAGLVKADDLVMTRKKKVSEDRSHGTYLVINDNKIACEGAEIVFLCVQPKQVGEVLQEVSKGLTKEQTLVSVVTGYSIEELRAHAGNEISIVRAMPNTAIALGSSMTCISYDRVNDNTKDLIKKVFSELGEILEIDESMMQASTVLAASGIAFFMRYLRAASQGGIQMGFHPEEAQKIAVQTAKGAADLIQKLESHPEIEIDKVTTPRGCTIEGLNEMEHQGFSSALIKGLMTSYYKINSIK